MLTASGRPVFVLKGESPAYRDFVLGISGDDVLRLEQALKRLGFDPGDVDGTYDEQTAEAVAQWYESAGWEPFGPTLAQLAHIRMLKQSLADATKNELTASATAAGAARAVKAARAAAEEKNKAAAAELAARTADRGALATTSDGGEPLAVEAARAKAGYADTAADAEIAARIASRALVVLDPRKTRTERMAAQAQLEVARAASFRTQLEGELAIQAARRQADLAGQQFEVAETTVAAARLSGEVAIQAALDAKKVAEFDAELAQQRTAAIAAELALARDKIGVQVPVDEVVFIPDLPVRVEQVTVVVGDPARGPVMSVTDNQLSIDSSVALDAAPLVEPGMKVAIDERAMGIKATGVVKRVADTPGTRGVDGYHIYFEVRVDETTAPLEGFSLRLTIPIESTEGPVLAVPVSALSLSADGTSRVQVDRDGVLEYLTVEPGLSADGFVEIAPVDGTLEPGQLVVVGYENSHEKPEATP